MPSGGHTGLTPHQPHYENQEMHLYTQLPRCLAVQKPDPPRGLRAEAGTSADFSHHGPFQTVPLPRAVGPVSRLCVQGLPPALHWDQFCVTVPEFPSSYIR